MYTRHNINFAVPPCGTPLPRALQSPFLLASFSLFPSVKIPVLFPPAFTLCSHWLTLVHNKKNTQEITARKSIRVIHSKKTSCHEPEKISAFPENERLKPENEPEKNLKIQVPLRNSQPRHPFALLPVFAFKPLCFFGQFNFSTQNSAPFQHFQPNRSKTPAIFPIQIGIPLCSAKNFSHHSRDSNPSTPGCPLFNPFGISSFLCHFVPCHLSFSTGFSVDSASVALLYCAQYRSNFADLFPRTFSN